MERVINWVRNAVKAPASSADFIEMEHQKQEPKVSVRTMQLTCFDDTKKVAAVLREGRTIMLLDVSPLKEKDVIDLKRSVNKLKNVSAEMGSEIAGLSGDWIVLAPAFAEIYRPKPVAQAPEMGDVSEE